MITSIENCIKNNSTCLVRYDENDTIYAEMILKDIMQAVESNRRFVLVVDDISLLSSSSLSNLLSRCAASGIKFVFILERFFKVTVTPGAFLDFKLGGGYQSKAYAQIFSRQPDQPALPWLILAEQQCRKAMRQQKKPAVQMLVYS